MKSQIFKTAWQIFRTQKVSFSQALSQAWSFAKKVSISIQTSWNKKTSTVYSLKSGSFNGQTGSLVRLFEMFVNSSPINNDGAAAYYGKGFYNAD